MKPYFHQNPSFNIADQVAEEFHQNYYPRFGLGDFFKNKVRSDCLSFLNRYDELTCGLWTIHDGESFMGSIALDGGQKNEEGLVQLRWFILNPNARGQGLGSALLEQSISFAQNCGYPGVFLWTVENNEPAGQLYRRRGFELSERILGTQWGKEVMEEKLVFKFENSESPK